MAIFGRKQRDVCYWDASDDSNVLIGHYMGDRPTGDYNDLVSTAGLSFGNSELYEHVGKDKTCQYCGNVNAPDARKCCGCQHAM